ncbi:phosphotransferase enzyme family protein [Maritalea sp.]|uniref:phosphotransferase enzyme family protein n=1 Tax=Maritalea sp. TaxID=2003361 RepID=UPI003EF250EB
MSLIENTGISRSGLTKAFDLWPNLQNSRFKLINHTENATFLIDMPNGQRKILRVHRPGYNTKNAIQSELAWSKALRADEQIKTPVALRGLNNQLVQSAPVGADAQEHFMVLFEFEAGVEPSPDDDLENSFVELGILAAKAHNHSQHWVKPAGFERLRWSANTILDPDGLWGNWRTAPGMVSDYNTVFERVDVLLRKRLRAFGSEAQRYGLIHADMRLANLLIDGDQIKLIDFDDCGFCWFLYDFAAAISFIEDSPQVPKLKQAWLKGYRTQRQLSASDEAEIDTFVMLRRMALTAWIGSHAETPYAKSLARDFVPRGAALAQKYLENFS